MTHEELLSIMDNYTFKDSAEPVKALRAVVELHKPFMYEGRFRSYERCGGCSDEEEFTLGNIYPCPTIQAIEKELK